MNHRPIANLVLLTTAVIWTLPSVLAAGPAAAKICEDCVVEIRYGVRQICFSQRRPNCHGKAVGAGCGRGGSCQEFRACTKRPRGSCCKCVYRFEIATNGRAPAGLVGGEAEVHWSVPGMLSLEAAMSGSCVFEVSPSGSGEESWLEVNLGETPERRPGPILP